MLQPRSGNGKWEMGNGNGRVMNFSTSSIAQSHCLERGAMASAVALFQFGHSHLHLQVASMNSSCWKRQIAGFSCVNHFAFDTLVDINGYHEVHLIPVPQPLLFHGRAYLLRPLFPTAGSRDIDLAHLAPTPHPPNHGILDLTFPQLAAVDQLSRVRLQPGAPVNAAVG